MRFMILVKATKDSEAGVMPPEKLLSDMQKFHEELQKAGVLRDASGLKPTVHGWRIKYDKNGKRSFIDGPFAESKELVAGFTVIETKTREEAIEWTQRYPNPAIDGRECEIEVRPYFELEDLGKSEAVERFKKMMGAAKR
jgi:hypothetical protein